MTDHETRETLTYREAEARVSEILEIITEYTEIAYTYRIAGHAGVLAAPAPVVHVHYQSPDGRSWTREIRYFPDAAIREIVETDLDTSDPVDRDLADAWRERDYGVLGDRLEYTYGCEIVTDADRHEPDTLYHKLVPAHAYGITS